MLIAVGTQLMEVEHMYICFVTPPPPPRQKNKLIIKWHKRSSVSLFSKPMNKQRCQVF